VAKHQPRALSSSTAAAPAPAPSSAPAPVRSAHVPRSEKEEEEVKAAGQKEVGRQRRGSGMTVGLASAAKGRLEMNPDGISRSEGQLKEQVKALEKFERSTADKDRRTSAAIRGFERAAAKAAGDKTSFMEKGARMQSLFNAVFVCVCVCVYTQKYIVHTNTHTHTHTNTHTQTHTHTHTNTHTQTHTHTHTRIYTGGE
jgi:hypothetical protein